MADFQRRHYRWIAEVIADIDDLDQRTSIYKRFSSAFQHENPHFKPHLFAKACKVNETQEKFELPHFGSQQ